MTVNAMSVNGQPVDTDDDAAVAFADMLRNGQTAERVLRLIVGWVEHTS